MCFSAEASFTAAALLSIIGCLTIKKAKQSNQLWLASAPLLFAFQQLIEGCLWVTYPQEAVYEQFGAIEKYIYLTFALAVWPTWISLSLLSVESIRWRKFVLMLFLLGGLTYSGIMIANIVRFWPSQDVTVAIVNHSIQYSFPIQNEMIYIVLYGLLTLVPPLFSSFKWIWQFAIANFLAAIVAQYFYAYTFVSVWCFFAAIISLSLYVVLSYQPLPRRAPN